MALFGIRVIFFVVGLSAVTYATKFQNGQNMRNSKTTQRPYKLRVLEAPATKSALFNLSQIQKQANQRGLQELDQNPIIRLFDGWKRVEGTIHEAWNSKYKQHCNSTPMAPLDICQTILRVCNHISILSMLSCGG